MPQILWLASWSMLTIIGIVILGIISYLILFPINYILCSIRAEIEVMNYYKEKHIQEKELDII